MNASWYGSLTILFFCILLQTGASSQQSAQVAGIVSDPTGAVIANALVTLHGDAVADVVARTDRGGRYQLAGWPGREYVILAVAPGFAPFRSDSLQLQSGKPRALDIRLKIAGDAQQVTVIDRSGLDTDPSQNGDSLILTGKDIDALPLDSAQLLAELQGLSGGLSPDIYVDGFSGGKLPPRDTIREIRINQNPYSALNDTSPGNGQIQIFTKPGSNKFHGDFFATGNASALNTRNQFAANQPPYYSYTTSGGFSGPIGRHASFFLDASRQTLQTNALVDAQALDVNNNQTFIAQSVSAPNNASVFSTRVDLAGGKKSTLVFRYSTNLAEQVNGGIGQLALASQGFDNHSTSQTLQGSNSQIVTEKIVNDTRFQYTRSRVRQTPGDTSPAINVAGAFTGGGNNSGAYHDNQDRYELQNYVSATAGRQFFTFGGRFRDTRDANHSTANYNGSYTFASLALSPSCTPLSTCSSYQVTEQGMAAGLSLSQIRASGGGASQFSITQGNPNVAVNVADGALFLQDDWKAKPNFTLSAGLRFETQNHIADHADWAPRLGFAWGVKTRKTRPPVYMIRGGAGFFYSRFTSGYVLQAARQNGVTQQQYLLNSPNCLPACNTPYYLAGAQSQSTIYQVSPHFHAPYFFSGTASIERQINTWGSVTLTYLFSRGIHTQLTRNINAPLPGTYNPAVPTSGIRPLGGTQNIYEYDSDGLDFSNRLTANFFFRLRNRYLLYGFYQIRDYRSDASGGFPSNQYDIGTDYGRAANDFRHSGYVGASAQLPFGIEAFSFIRAQSGTPYDITVGQDLNGDSIFNDRPAFATDLTRPSVVHTALGIFDTSPIAGQTIIPRNYGHGPGLFLVNLNFNREFRFGPEIKPANSPAQKLAPGEKPQINRRYSINFGIEADNLFNQVNLAQPIGTLNSPLFGRSIALNGMGSSSANRVVQLQTFFSF